MEDAAAFRRGHLTGGEQRLQAVCAGGGGVGEGGREGELGGGGGRGGRREGGEGEWGGGAEMPRMSGS